MRMRNANRACDFGLHLAGHTRRHRPKEIDGIRDRWIDRHTQTVRKAGRQVASKFRYLTVTLLLVCLIYRAYAMWCSVAARVCDK